MRSCHSTVTGFGPRSCRSQAWKPFSEPRVSPCADVERAAERRKCGARGRPREPPARGLARATVDPARVGVARHRADALGTAPYGLALWDGEAGDGPDGTKGSRSPASAPSFSIGCGSTRGCSSSCSHVRDRHRTLGPRSAFSLEGAPLPPIFTQTMLCPATSLTAKVGTASGTWGAYQHDGNPFFRFFEADIEGTLSPTGQHHRRGVRSGLPLRAR
jgi:hypothetical protein